MKSHSVDMVPINHYYYYYYYYKRGIIEPVIKSGKTEYVQYLTYHALVRKEAKITKVRFLYNASSKDSEKAVPLNDSLRVGPPLTPIFFCYFVMAQGKG